MLEKEICEPLADLKLGLEALSNNLTFKSILNVTLTIGNFLNGSSAKGFNIDYLAKVNMRRACSVKDSPDQTGSPRCLR